MFKKKTKKRSWKTSLSGVVTILAGVGQVVWAVTHNTEPQWAVSTAVIVAGIGLLYSRDDNRSSRDVGVE